MALPTLETPENKGQVQEIISDIATAVFKSAKISMESAAKAVVPSVPEMVNEVLDDLKSGSIQKFNLAMDKLDKLVRTLGIDLKQYNKELANFAARREEKITKSEEKIQLLKEKNIVAEIEKSGDIKILSNRDIETKKDNLKLLEKNIAKLEKSLEKDRKLLQESDKLKTRAQANKKEEVKQNILKLDNMKKERETEKQILGKRGEQQPGILQRGRERVGSFVDEYVPDPIADVGNAMVEGFMAPINAVKDLGKSFGQLLKPLKLLRPLFTGIISGLKKFALGLKGAILGFLPFIAIAGLVIVGLFALYKAFEKIKKFFDKFRSDRESEFDMGPQETDVDISSDANTKEKGYEGNMTRTPFVHGEHGTPEAKVVGVNDPDYDKLYREQFGKEPPKQGEVFNSRTGKTSILPLTKDGELIKSSNFMENRSAKNLRSPDNLKPISYKEKEQKINSVIDSSVKNFSSSNTTVTGLNGPRDIDMEIFRFANPLYR